MRSSGRSAPILLLVLSLAAVLAAQDDGAADWGEAAFHHMEGLSAIGSRVAGSATEGAAASYIEAAFREAGYQPDVQAFSLGRRGGNRNSANIIATKPGVGSRQIIVGAHYDSEVRGQGADDNASGVGILLETAARLRNVTTPYTIRFVAFGAEEVGLQGSRHYVSGMDGRATADTVAMINLDSVTAGDIAYVYGTEGAEGRIRDWVLAQARSAGLDLETQDVGNPEYPAGTTCNCSDHAPFEAAGIQYAYFESTNWALGERDGYTQVSESLAERGKIWHTPYDTLDFIEATFPGRIESRLSLFSRMLYRILTEYREG